MIPLQVETRRPFSVMANVLSLGGKCIQSQTPSGAAGPWVTSPPCLTVAVTSYCSFNLVSSRVPPGARPSATLTIPLNSPHPSHHTPLKVSATWSPPLPRHSVNVTSLSALSFSVTASGTTFLIPQLSQVRQP